MTYAANVTFTKSLLFYQDKREDKRIFAEGHNVEGCVVWIEPALDGGCGMLISGTFQGDRRYHPMLNRAIGVVMQALTADGVHTFDMLQYAAADHPHTTRG